jgi:hypothetical protein
MEHDNPCNLAGGETACADLPELKRLNYFHGQMLGVNDFRTEQHYFREKIKLHNRCLHGYGTVCGLKVGAVPTAQECNDEAGSARQHLQAELDILAAMLEQARKEKDAAAVKKLEEQVEQARRSLEQLPAGCAAPTAARVLIECGLALDCEGNEIIVPRPYDFDPWQLLSEAERRLVQDHSGSEGEGVDLFLSICYCEQPADPVRPVTPNACGATPECNAGKLRDAFRLRLASTAPPSDQRCETCCSGCKDACLLLAVLRGYRKGQAPKAIDNSVRRLVSTYPATVITGISWTHGATYSSDDAAAILGSPDAAGIQVDFSRPVLTSTLKDGVVDLWVIEGGRTRKAGVYYLEGKFENPGSGAARSLRFTYQGDEQLDPGDRVMITIRCAFILDECCRPVDGVHVGGRAPLIPAFKQFDRAAPQPQCEREPHGYGPWTTGAGTPGSTFESWFFIEPAKNDDKRRAYKENVK